MWKKIISVLVLISMMLITNTTNINAKDIAYMDENIYISNMDTTIVAKDNFSFHVEQEIEVQLNNNHGIFINVAYEPGVNNITNIKVDGPGSYKVKTTDENDVSFKTIKIGDEKELYDGIETWTISYDIKGMKKSSDVKDYLSLSVMPAHWELPIESATTTVKMPKKVQWDKIKTTTSGDMSIKDDEHFTLKTTDKTLVVKAEDLPSKYGASIGLDLPAGYWKNVPVVNRYPLYMIGLLVAWLIFIIWCWKKYGQDKKVVEVVEFYPPKKMDPLQLGYLIDGEVDHEDIASMIIYFANQGLVKIEEYGKQKKHKKFKITKIKNISKKAPKHQKVLFNSMFKKGDVFDTNKDNKYFAKKAQSVINKIEEPVKDSYDVNALLISIGLLLGTTLLSFITLKFIMSRVGISIDWKLLLAIFLLGCFININTKIFVKRKNRIGFKVKLDNYVCYLLAVIITIIGFTYLIGNYCFATVPGIIIGILVISCFTMTYYVRKNSDELVEVSGQVLGFKDFIKTAELDRINTLVEENPKYFFDILPYAYVLGLTKKWIKNFKDVAVVKPDWFEADIVELATICAALNLIMHKTTYMVEKEINRSEETINENLSEMGDSLFSGFSNDGGESADGGFGSSGGGVW